MGPPIGRVLGELLRENRQLPILDLLAERAHQWALGSQETIDRIVSRDSPAWSPKFVDAMLGEKIHRELVEFTWKVRSNPEHEVRQAANRFLVDFADDLQNDPATMEKAEKIKAEIMGREEVTGLAAATWKVAKRLIMESVDDPDSTLRTKVAENVVRFGERLRDDNELRTKVDVGARRHALRRRPLHRRDHRDHLRHRRALGRRGGVQEDRAPGGPRSPVHPYQRHRGRCDRGPADLHVLDVAVRLTSRGTAR